MWLDPLNRRFSACVDGTDTKSNEPTHARTATEAASLSRFAKEKKRKKREERERTKEREYLHRRLPHRTYARRQSTRSRRRRTFLRAGNYADSSCLQVARNQHSSSSLDIFTFVRSFTLQFSSGRSVRLSRNLAHAGILIAVTAVQPLTIERRKGRRPAYVLHR